MSSYGVLGVFEQLAGRRKDFTAVHIKSTAGLLALQVGRQITALRPEGPAHLRRHFHWKDGKQAVGNTGNAGAFDPGENFFQGKSIFYPNNFKSGPED